MIQPRTLAFIMIIAVVVAGTALAGPERLHLTRGEEGVYHGEPITAKALGDTIYLLGDPTNPDQYHNGIPPQANGTFEDQFGNPDWAGWTHSDETYVDEAYWHVSDHLPIAGDYSMWCGTVYREGEPGEDAGYGNSWNQSLVFTQEVANNTVASSVTLSCTLQNDTEPFYDFTYIEFNVGGAWETAASYDGERVTGVYVTQDYEPVDYVGPDNDEIQVRVRVYSDGAWSDEDGLWDTDGACRIDDVLVSVDGATVDEEDFEDQVSDRWVQVPDPGVGDYAALYQVLQDVDYCQSNYSWQVAFVDDGILVPGTGGTWCTTWCYGPNGFIVNNTGGLMGPDYHIDNMVISPPLEWPDGADAARFAFDVYRHEELGAYNTWPGVFYTWHVRSVATGDPDDLAHSTWGDRSFVNYGGPGYQRRDEVITDLLTYDLTHVQVGLRVVELGYIWGWVGTDGTPAPYFDNASVRAYPFAGPAMAARTIDLFNDGFPARGDLDLADLANNAVRLDAAQNVAPETNMVNYPGDSIWFDVQAAQAGSQLVGNPTLHVRIIANPLFDGVRVLPPNFTQTANIIEGWVSADSTFTWDGVLIADRYHVDLPDVNFFFPGDVLRYYLRAEDSLGGVSLLPADTTGFVHRDENLYTALRYPRDFEVRALPTLHSTHLGDQPPVIFWQDAIDRGGFNEWLHALGHIGMRQGVHFDLYATNAPSSGVGNGLGGRATSALLSGYDVLLYTSASLGLNLLSNGDYANDPSKDLQVVTNWFAQGGKHALMTGDNIVSGLLDAGSLGQEFVDSFFNVDYLDRTVQQFIGDQIAPVVATIPGNGVIAQVPEWIAYGGCPAINLFDAVEVRAGSLRLAEYTDAIGNTGVYPYAAGSYYYNDTYDAEIVMLPYDLMYVHNVAGWQPPAGYAGIPARSIVLEDILWGFGHWAGLPVGVAPDAPLASHNFPNPFNPSTTIRLSLPKAGRVSLKVFNLRGELVRTLVDGRLEAGAHDIAWDGRGGQGRALASGVYFYEVRAGGEALVAKMTLLK